MPPPSDEESQETSPSQGWTNERVRDGFAVDGSESRLHPLGMDRRIHLAQAEYEVWSGAVGDGRVFYPAIRLLGRLLGRERAAEQWIAETEYVIDHGEAIDRSGIGTRRWWLGVAYLFVVLTGTFAISIALVGGLIMGLPRVLTITLGINPGDARSGTALALILVGTVGLAWLLIRVAQTTNQ